MKLSALLWSAFDFTTTITRMTMPIIRTTFFISLPSISCQERHWPKTHGLDLPSQETYLSVTNDTFHSEYHYSINGVRIQKHASLIDFQKVCYWNSQKVWQILSGYGVKVFATPNGMKCFLWRQQDFSFPGEADAPYFLYYLFFLKFF